jgi:SAM-dependent methyltransferase
VARATTNLRPSPADTRGHRLARRFLPSRAFVDHALDRIRFRVDTFPFRVYQPLPWLGIEQATRGTGTVSRLEAMLPVLETEQVTTVLDVGCNVGYYILRLAEQGFRCIGVEDDPPTYRTALLAIRRSGLENVGLQIMRVTPVSAELLPAADATLMLSTWHHFVRNFGVEGASEIVRQVWRRSARVLFFDTGADEMGDEYGLPPLEPDPRSWIQRYLADQCAPAEILHLGQHDAFGPDGRPVRRDLFAAVRTSA